MFEDILVAENPDFWDTNRRSVVHLSGPSHKISRGLSLPLSIQLMFTMTQSRIVKDLFKRATTMLTSHGRMKPKYLVQKVIWLIKVKGMLSLLFSVQAY